MHTYIQTTHAPQTHPTSPLLLSMSSSLHLQITDLNPANPNSPIITSFCLQSTLRESFDKLNLTNSKQDEKNLGSKEIGRGQVMYQWIHHPQDFFNSIEEEGADILAYEDCEIKTDVMEGTPLLGFLVFLGDLNQFLVGIVHQEKVRIRKVQLTGEEVVFYGMFHRLYIRNLETENMRMLDLRTFQITPKSELSKVVHYAKQKSGSGRIENNFFGLGNVLIFENHDLVIMLKDNFVDIWSISNASFLKKVHLNSTFKCFDYFLTQPATDAVEGNHEQQPY
jgi:hypothetical protein